MYLRLLVPRSPSRLRAEQKPRFWIPEADSLDKQFKPCPVTPTLNARWPRRLPRPFAFWGVRTRPITPLAAVQTPVGCWPAGVVVWVRVRSRTALEGVLAAAALVRGAPVCRVGNLEES